MCLADVLKLLVYLFNYLYIFIYLHVCLVSLWEAIIKSVTNGFIVPVQVLLQAWEVQSHLLHSM